MFATLHWNPPREAFHLPLLDRPVMWYGVFFALGFGIAYFVFITLLKEQFRRSKKSPEPARALVDSLLLYAVIGTIIGARLGDVLFYDLSYFLQHPEDIIKTWNGGLASHGGVVGVVLATLLFWWRNKERLPSKNFFAFLDIFALASLIACTFIRIGNFFNQEIIGTPSSLPFAVLFENPMDHVSMEPRHPVQLYEAIAYLALFFALYFLWKRKKRGLPVGLLSGLILTLGFGLRFLLEFFKHSQGVFAPIPYLDMGQLLSIPFILTGFFLVKISLRKSN